MALETDGDPREAKMRLAAPIDDQALVHGEAIVWENRADWSKRDRKVVARRQERFGNVVDDRISNDALPKRWPSRAGRCAILACPAGSLAQMQAPLLYEGGGGTLCPVRMPP